MSAFRLLTWNVAGRVRERQEQQIDAVGAMGADVVCLQEVTPTTRGRWTAALEALGFLHEWREGGLSDHSGMWAEIEPRPV